MKSLALTLLAVFLLTPAAAHAEGKALDGEYLKSSCMVFNNVGTIEFKDKADGFDKGIDAGFCSGFLLGLLNTNFRMTQKAEKKEMALFCPPQDLPVDEAARLVARELDRLPPHRLYGEQGLDLALEIFAKAYPCGT